MRTFRVLGLLGAAALLVTTWACGDDLPPAGQQELGAAACKDSVDNDGDGLIDCKDDDCLAYCSGKTENTAALCQDTKDNDEDGKTDCQDDDCKGYTFCASAENTSTACADKKDNDGDGKTDCDDTDCAGFTFCKSSKTETSPAACADKQDNDGDGKTDCDDDDCKGYYFCAKVENTAALCQDKLDNDGDGKTDCDDTDCAGFTFCATKTETSVADCMDGKDNDSDGKTDCDDTDCQGWAFCVKKEDTAALCQDKKDNDGDGFTDCADSDCKGFTFCVATQEYTPTACQDGKDNDNDGKTDCDDTDCKGYYFCQKTEDTAALCQDTKDNDGDGKIDCADTDCQGFYFCLKSESTTSQCQDKKDNDGDGKTDCDDTDCQGYYFCQKIENTAALCQDTKDNDGDGKTDCDDTDCKSFYFCQKYENTAALCNDKKDNDGDSKIDCDDTDCQVFSFCAKSENTVTACKDGKDNDGDKLIDCKDTDCQGFTFCQKVENTSATCQDKVDNDGDGYTDCADTDCQGFYFCSSNENTAALCKDAKDNDGDGKIDCADTDCQGFTFCAKIENTAALCQDKKDNDSDGKVDCDDTDCQGFTFCAKSEISAAQCTDKKDNDGDGKIDCDDTDCGGYYFCQKLENTATLCKDGKDNDGDKLIDCKDSDCQAFSMCQAGGYEATAAQCTDKSDNDGDGKIDCADQGCWHWYFCGHYSGFPVSDAWGATWDGQPRAGTTWAKADAACKALGGRLPTATELHRNNTKSGGSTISGPQATEYLWTLISTYQTSYKATVRLSDGTTSSTTESSSVQYRCIWPKANATKGYNAGRCHGTPGSTCTAYDQIWNIDTQDRPLLDYAAATNECSFYGGSIPSLTDWSENIHAGLKNGSNTWLWAGKAMYWYSGGHGAALVRWTGTGKDRWYFYQGSSMGSLAYTYSKNRFRCVGLASPSNFTAPTNSCNGGCLTVNGRRSVILMDKTDRTNADYKTAFANCRALGGDLPTLSDVTEAIHHKAPNGTNKWIWLSEAMYWYSGAYGHPLVRWSGTGDDYWSFNGWGTKASLAYPYSKVNYRCIWRTKRKALPTCATGQVLKLSGGKLACATQVKGTSAGKAQSEKIDQWNNAWDGLERGSYATYANAAQLCKLYGGRLPTVTELYRVRASGNPHKTIGTTSNTNYLWTTSPNYRDGYRQTVRVSDGNLTYYKETSTRPYRCVWPATVSDVLFRGNCHGPPGKECFSTSGGMLADAYDRPAMDTVAASYECITSGGHLPDSREFARLAHQGWTNGSNNWLWIEEPLYWYSGHYGYAMGRWSGVGTSSWDWTKNTYGYLGYGHNNIRFRCVYSPFLK